MYDKYAQLLLVCVPVIFTLLVIWIGRTSSVHDDSEHH